ERDARLRVPPGAHPAFDRDGQVLWRLAGQDPAHAELAVVHRSRVTEAEQPCPVSLTDRQALPVGNGGRNPIYTLSDSRYLFDRPILVREPNDEVAEEAIGGEAEDAQADNTDEDLVRRHPQA